MTVIVGLLAVLLVAAYIAGIALIVRSVQATGRRQREAAARQPRVPPPRPWLAMQEADERHARRWGDQGPSGLTRAQWEEGRALATRRGELVRSWPEVRIADWLHAHGLDYAYEPAVCGGLRPDFLLPVPGVIVEYWGMGGAEYDARRRQKTATYLRAGYQLVSLEPGKPVSLEEDLRRQLWHKGVRPVPAGARTVQAAA
ncbi:MAG: hypothetical protein QOD77_534 [Thermoplasmata archaeon]|jgi:hypothetical protein|nr:hypothetical protein [Thermoplasmata archaeon]